MQILFTKLFFILGILWTFSCLHYLVHNHQKLEHQKCDQEEFNTSLEIFFRHLKIKTYISVKLLVQVHSSKVNLKVLSLSTTADKPKNFLYCSSCTYSRLVFILCCNFEAICFRIVDCLNLLRGLFFFLIFTCKKKILGKQSYPNNESWLIRKIFTPDYCLFKLHLRAVCTFISRHLVFVIRLLAS